MEKYLSDELDSKMNGLKNLISEHAIEQVQKKSRTVCLVRVFQGGRNARQLEPVQQALAEFVKRKLIEVEYIDTDTVKMQHLTVQSIVQWLLSSDVHLIITHMHQGIMELLRWNMTDLVLELQLLYSHPGYPTGRSLEDPIFLQDKFKYIEPIKDFFEDTLKILIKNNICDDDGQAKSIKEFLERHQPCGFVLKLPFVTNRSHMQYPKDYDDIINCVNNLFLKFDKIYPYVMLQRQHKNSCEYKVVLFNGHAKYICVSQRNNNSRAFSNKKQLMEFAETAVAMLKHACPSICCEALIRVDIMISNDDKIIVNEFESLEACTYSAKRCIQDEANLNVQLTTFWKTILLKYIELP